MKKLILLLTTVLLAFVGFSQDFEGKITYEIKYIEMPEGMEQYVAMLPSQSIIYIKDNMSRLESSMGMGGTQIAINDSKKNTSVALIDMMGQKIMYKATEEDMKKQDKEAKNLKIEYLDETKEIAGYTAKRANVSAKDSEDMIVVWYTEDLPTNGSQSFKKLKGFPMEYEMSQQGMTMQYTVSNVSKEDVPDELFEIPEGYTEMSKEDMMKMMGGGGQ